MRMFKFSEDPGYDAFRILQLTFTIAPVLAGLDKFFYLLTDWSQYISPFVLRIIHDHDQHFMMFVGIIEIIAGIGIIFKPKIFAYVISLWLLGIIINLLLTGYYFDIALRDLGLLLAAVSLGRLSEKYAH
jgi:uncharacterized membrane protein YphA (DoxX/SURF4 family)